MQVFAGWSCQPQGLSTTRYGGLQRVNPATGICEGCGNCGCTVCGREDCPDHNKNMTGTARSVGVTGAGGARGGESR